MRITKLGTPTHTTRTAKPGGASPPSFRPALGVKNSASARARLVGGLGSGGHGYTVPITVYLSDNARVCLEV